MRSTQKKKSPDLNKIQHLIDNVSECQQQAVNLKLGLIHYFLDMASTELKLLQNEDRRAAASPAPSKSSEGRARGSGSH